MHIAYLTTQYPKVSHTFIRREIAGLEARGHTIMRLAIRTSGEPLRDPADLAEVERVRYCLEKRPMTSLLLSAMRTAVGRPVATLRALRTALTMSRASDRGFIRHMAYFIEALDILGALRAEDVEHVHVHFGTNSATVARLIRHLGGPTYSMTVHGPNEFDAVIGLSLPEKIQDALFVLAVSSFGRGQLSRWVDLEYWDRLHVIHCTVDDRFLEEAPPIDPDSRTFVCVGRLSAQKGHGVLIEAFGRLVQEDEQARLVLVGDGELREHIERRLRELGIEDHVEITGWLGEAEVRSCLTNARAMVLPSFAEGLPVVIMEALALQRPVISTMVAGIPELVRHGENGWLIPAGSVDDLTVALREALRTPASTLADMGKAGRDAVARHHASPELEALEGLFHRYLHGDGSPTER